MVFREKKKKCNNELRQAIGEQDVLMLRRQLKQIQNSGNKNVRNYGMSAMEDIQF